MEGLIEDLTEFVTLMQGEYDRAAKDYPTLLKVVTDVAITQYALLFALRGKELVTDEDMEEAFYKAKAVFQAISLRMGNAGGSA